MSAAPDPTAGDARPGPAAPVRRPDPVRLRVLELAADRLGNLEAARVPPALRRIARFAPAKRARLGAVPLAVALETDEEFRDGVADALREALPELVEALADGVALPALPAAEVAAAAYLLRSPHWPDLVAEADQVATGPGPGAVDPGSAHRLREQLTAAREQARLDLGRHRTELDAARAEAAELRRRLGETRERARRAELDAAAAHEGWSGLQASAAAALAAAEAESRRLRSRLADAEAAAESARRADREGRASDALRLRLLLDTVQDAARGLQRELALPPVTARPADRVTGEEPAADEVQAQGRSPEDPALLDALLAVPQTHLVIDGYNVTKLGYGTLPLVDQRNRLLAGLAGLAARTGSEVTVVFDGSDVRGVRLAPPRGVRVRFSPAGEIADDLIRRLVAAEPPGRPVVVVSTDREVADGVRRSGARAIPSVALLRLLDRGVG